MYSFFSSVWATFLATLRRHGFVLLPVGCLLFFGLQNITHFETVDEHFWKYERIPQYWNALADGKLKKTAVNDKPGITVAFFSGAGLLFIDPKEHRIRDTEATKNGDVTLYDSGQTERINKALRTPAVHLGALLLILMYVLLLRLFASRFLATTFVLLVALSPILVGITQIINPDAYLWSFSFLALIVWLCFLQKPSRGFVLGTGVLLALAVLSKYSALILLPVFLGLLVWPLSNGAPAAAHVLQQRTKGFFGVLIVATLVFSLFLPAVFVKPILLWESTLGFFAAQGTLLQLGIITFLLCITVWFIPQKVTSAVGWIQKTLERYGNFLVLPPFILLATTFFLGFGNQSLVPLEAHFLSAKEDGSLAFPLLAHTPALIAWLIKLCVEAYAIVFSLQPLLWLSICGFLIAVLLKKSRLVQKNPLFLWVTLLALWLIVLFLASNLAAGVLVNARYGIILFPWLLLLSSFGISEVAQRFPKQRFLVLALVGVFLLVSMQRATPFLFNYTSPLLSRQFVIHDSWGYGLYEAAQYLNSLPSGNEPIYIWSDRNGICQFLSLKVQCVTGNLLHKESTPLSYLVVSKRGLERGYKPRWINEVTGKKEQIFDYLMLEEKAIWRLNILDRPDNFILIVPVTSSE
jgi:4-amino-4-deoxy-L-arabinose transferase-like glycosyltransferase